MKLTDEQIIDTMPKDPPEGRSQRFRDLTVEEIEAVYEEFLALDWSDVCDALSLCHSSKLAALGIKLRARLAEARTLVDACDRLSRGPEFDTDYDGWG